MHVVVDEDVMASTLSGIIVASFSAG